VKILFCHGWHSVVGGVKPTYLKDAGHEVLNPALDDDDFAAAVRTAQAEYDQHQPDVIVGSSRGGAVAMNIDSKDTPLVLLCPAWGNWGTVTKLKPNSVIIHSSADDVIPFADSEQLIANSGLPHKTLIEIGNDHRLADPEPLKAMLAACEQLAGTSDTPLQEISRRRVFSKLIGLPVFIALFMFVPAGTWTWPKGWLFILVLLFIVPAVFLILQRVNPEVIVARSRFHKGTKHWDKILLSLYFPAMAAVLLVAALDDGRFRWFPVPWWVCGIGYALLVAGLAIVTWAESVNRFFEITVRIQTERGHSVIDTGPYAYIRHPGYVGGIMHAAGIALSLGSLWALIPAVVASVVLIVRTRWEDQTLQEELHGYKEYAARVHYKLIPGLW
jgi:protein-S-isoprenylcysteine O-methyltransferase Ste14